MVSCLRGVMYVRCQVCEVSCLHGAMFTWCLPGVSVIAHCILTGTKPLQTATAVMREMAKAAFNLSLKYQKDGTLMYMYVGLPICVYSVNWCLKDMSLIRRRPALWWKEIGKGRDKTDDRPQIAGRLSYLSSSIKANFSCLQNPARC